MQITDPIADMLTRIRNAGSARHETVDVPNSKMKKAIAEGKIGKPVSAYAQFTCWYPDIPGAWRQKKTQGGGGALVDMGVHCIDLMQYVTGSKVKQVAAFHDTLTFHYEVEDTSKVMMRL